MKRSFVIILLALVISWCGLDRIVQADLNDGLVAYYPFNGNANDESGNGHDGTLLNGANVSNGVLTLDGVDDYVQVDTHVIPTSGNYTVALWVKQSASQTIHVEFISQGAPGIDGPGFYIGHDPEGQLRVTDVWAATGVLFPTDGQFHHFALVVDADVHSQSSFYIDGVLRTTIPYAIETTTAGTGTRFGRQFETTMEYFGGFLDEIRIYDDALSESEVQELYNENIYVPLVADLNDGLVAYYPFNGNANDESGNESDGVVNGAVLIEDRFGNADSAYSFDGIDDHIFISETKHPTGEVTVTYSAWVYLESGRSNDAVIIDIGSGTAIPGQPLKPHRGALF